MQLSQLSSIQGYFITLITPTWSPPDISLVDLSYLLASPPILSGYLILLPAISLTPWPSRATTQVNS